MDHNFATNDKIDSMEKILRTDMEKMEQSIRADFKQEILSVHHKIDSMGDKLTIRMTGVLVVAITVLKYLG